MTGRLIIITGTTGSGKTTTCQEFVTTADDLWLHFGVDLFLGTLVPRQYADSGPRCSEGLHMVPDDPTQPSGPAHFELGSEGPGMVRAFHEMVAAAVRSGQRVVMDHITTMHPPFLQDCLARLQGLPVLFVALRPAEELLNQRIKARMEEYIKSSGIDPEYIRHAHENLQRVRNYMMSEIFSHDCFDLTIDSGALAPHQVVERIRTRLQEGSGEAFPKLAKRYDLTIDPFTGGKTGEGTG